MRWKAADLKPEDNAMGNQCAADANNLGTAHEEHAADRSGGDQSMRACEMDAPRL